ncbi:hypothetical protein [Salinimicrobium sp. GXAS 041]|uniref:hypothetical protein n=1 Tax=Salinimicrobium sp. GXAS 041 TaxID=3400806 RepID=UPI003C7161FB
MPHTLILIIGGVGGALFTFLLHKYGLSVVVASCLVGLLGAALEHFLKVEHLAFVIFAGSFVGMTSSSVATLPLVVLGGALSAVLYQLSYDIFKGFGGRLGTIAFISTVIAFYFLLALKKFFIKNK